jgi:predicted nucleic acid-binding protein
VREALAAIRTLCGAIHPVDLEIRSAGVSIAERYGYGVFDALMIAAALRADCDTLWSKDMQDGIVIDGRLWIANPFRARPG